MKDGEYIEYYDSGEIYYRCFYLGGERHGESIYYYISGEIGTKCNFIGGKLHGESISYDYGEIFYKSYYLNDIEITEFEWISYNRNKKLELLGL